MTDPDQMPISGYESFYGQFDSHLMRQVREEAYGKDIGQHSWVTMDELTQDISRLGLSRESRLLDLGCGPGGPLTFVVSKIGCHATGVDASRAAVESARIRAESLHLTSLIDFQVADVNDFIPFQSCSFSAVMSIDVILHLRDREAIFNEVARVLVSGGRFLFTDAGVITGLVSSEEVRQRALYGFTQFSPQGFNERMVELAGFRLLETFDRTASLLRNAKGRLSARMTHCAELQQVEGEAYFGAQQRYLETVISLSERGAVSRVMYLAERDERDISRR